MDGDIVMCGFVASQPGHQSFSAQTSVDTQPSESSKLGINNFPVPDVSKAIKPRPILASEWSQVERLLRHLYIEKNQTLKAVQRYLRENYGLIVSEKQLTRKFSQWNLKKNFKRREREALIQECRITQDNQDIRWAQEGHGKAIAKKLVRWEKEIAISSKPNFQLCLKEKTGASTCIQGERGEAKTIHASGQAEFLVAGTESTSTVADNRAKDHTILIAQLFAKLDIDAPADIELFHIKVKLIEETTASDSDPVPFASIHTDVPFGTKTCATVTTWQSTSNLRL